MGSGVKRSAFAAGAAGLIVIGGASGSAGAGSIAAPQPAPNLERLANALGDTQTDGDQALGPLAKLDNGLQLVATNEALGRPLGADARVPGSAAESGGRLSQAA